MKEIYNIVELFSGIGSQARALKKIGFNINVQNTCEWDIHAFVAYDAIHENNRNLPQVDSMEKDELLEKLKDYTLSNDGKTPMEYKTLRTYDVEILKRVYSAILRTNNLVDISKVSGSSMPNDTDILTYSFPCQDLSNVGAFHHYNKGIDKDSGSRSSLLWQVGRILNEMKESNKHLPRYLIMENVPTLLSPRHKDNFDLWKKELEELGYFNWHVRVNARNYGIPQNRPRLLMISVLLGKNAKANEQIKEYLESLTETKIINDYKQSQYYKNISVKSLLRIPQNAKSDLWDEALACTPNDTPSRRRIWNENPKIVDENGKLMKDKFIRTLTTKQDRNPNSGNIYFDTGINGLGKFRYLTPRECLLFMGFEDKDYEQLINVNPCTRKNSKLFPRDKIIRMAGNSIPVNMLEGFFYQIYKIEEILEY